MKFVTPIIISTALFLIGFLAGRGSAPEPAAVPAVGSKDASLTSTSDTVRGEDAPGRRDRSGVERRGQLLAGRELAAAVRKMLADWKEGEVDVFVPSDQVDPDRQPLFDVVTFNRLVTSMSYATPIELEEVRASFREQADDSIFAAIWGTTLEMQCQARELEVDGSVALDRALANARLESESEDESLVHLSSLVFAYARIAPENANRWVEGVIADVRPLPEGSTAEFLRAALKRARASGP